MSVPSSNRWVANLSNYLYHNGLQLQSTGVTGTCKGVACLELVGVGPGSYTRDHFLVAVLVTVQRFPGGCSSCKLSVALTKCKALGRDPTLDIRS